MLPLLSLHALAAQRGDGLRPELLALLKRRACPANGLSAEIEAERTTGSCESPFVAADEPAVTTHADESSEV